MRCLGCLFATRSVFRSLVRLSVVVCFALLFALLCPLSPAVDATGEVNIDKQYERI